MRLPAAARDDPLYLRGVVLMLSAGAIMSVNGVLFRSIEAASDWQVVFYRTAFMALSVLVILAVRERGRVTAAFRAAGPTGLVGGLILGIGNVCFTLSILHTTVANALFIVSASPFFAAILGWFMLRERVRRSTLIAMPAVLVGVGLMVGDGLIAGRLTGNLIAIGTALAHAGYVITVRIGKAVDMVPAVCLAGTFAALLAATLAPDLRITGHDLLILALMGTLAMGLGFMCFTLGARHVPAGEVALLSMSEVVLGPIWVWVGFSEVPSALTLAGGFLVLSAIVGQAAAVGLGGGAGARPADPIP